MSMLESVLSQFEEEIKNNSDPNLQAISDFLLRKAEEPGSGLVERLLENEKSLSSCLKYILKKVFLQITKGGTERPKGDFAVSAVQSDCVFDWALEYYRSDEGKVEFDPKEMMPKPKTTYTAPAKKTQPQKKPQNLVSFPSLFDIVEKPAEQEAVSQEPDDTETDECGEEDEDENEGEAEAESNSVGDEEPAQPVELSVSETSADQSFILNPPKSGVIPIAAPVVAKALELKVVRSEVSKQQEPTEPTGELFKDVPVLSSEKKKRSKSAVAVDYGQISLFAANY